MAAFCVFKSAHVTLVGQTDLVSSSHRSYGSSVSVKPFWLNQLVASFWLPNDLHSTVGRLGHGVFLLPLTSRSLSTGCSVIHSTACFCVEKSSQVLRSE